MTVEDHETAAGDGAAPVRAGNRRIDRVLAEGYLDGLAQGSLAEVRALRAEAEQEEVDLSYVRRMVQGRIDILRAELERRGGAVDGTLLERLSTILADQQRAPARGLGRHSTLEPSRAAEHRRYVEQLVHDADLSDVGTSSDAELTSALETLVAEETTLSSKRREVQAVMDACSAEITRRYREGEADVSALLSSPAGS